MKKENKQKKREAEQEAEREEKDRQFKRQGNICLAVIVVCFVLMPFEAHVMSAHRTPAAACDFAAHAAEKGFGVIIAAAFLYSLRNAGRRLKEMREENRPRG